MRGSHTGQCLDTSGSFITAPRCCWRIMEESVKWRGRPEEGRGGEDQVSVFQNDIPTLRKKRWIQRDMLVVIY